MVNIIIFTKAKQIRFEKSVNISEHNFPGDFWETVNCICKMKKGAPILF